jgi:hypothetical protein
MRGGYEFQEIDFISAASISFSGNTNDGSKGYLD